VLKNLRERLGALDAALGSIELFEILRVERGRPAFGRELDEETLPPEAGITDRAIDHGKGCYTGQEVIVRIRDRGKVNRLLCGVLLGSADPPPMGTPLIDTNRGIPVGETRSAVLSPRFGQTIALAYLRSDVQPGTHLRLGATDGPEASARALEQKGWVLVDGDSAFIA
jgi:folate-binding protein YgfZ